jgi:hypothetical protein
MCMPWAHRGMAICLYLSVCLSIHNSALEPLDAFWWNIVLIFPTGEYPKFIHLSFVHWVIQTWRTHKTVRWQRKWHHLRNCYEMMYDNWSLKKMQHLFSFPLVVSHVYLQQLGASRIKNLQRKHVETVCSLVWKFISFFVSKIGNIDASRFPVQYYSELIKSWFLVPLV